MNAQQIEQQNIIQWIIELKDPEKRAAALQRLSQNRETIPNLAPMLWYSFGTIAILLQEISSVYNYINPPSLTVTQSHRVCNAMALFQCIAVHPETRTLFLKAKIPVYIYPFLKTTSNVPAFEYLRVTALGVMGSLVKTDGKEAVTSLLKSEIIPICLRNMEYGSHLGKTMATFVLQKILHDERGFSHVCKTNEGLSHIATVLGKVVIHLAEEPSARLLKHVIQCYLRLSDNPWAREALRQCLPHQMRDNTFSACLQEDESTQVSLQLLINNLGLAVVPNAQLPN